MRTMLAPAAGLVAVALAVGLAGCTAEVAPTPTPSETASAAPETDGPTAPPTGSPTTVGPLPGSALLRVSATADVDGTEMRLELTFSRALAASAASGDFEAVLDECANAVSSQLEIFPGLEPTGVLRSDLEMVGDWPEGMTIAVAAGGTIASFGEGRNIAPTDDTPGAFGCTVPVVTGPGTASFVSLLLGDPAVTDRIDLEQQVAHGLFGFESDAGSAVEVRWRDCVIQLSSAAQRLADENGWVTPSGWGDGCLIGDGGTV